MHRPAAKILESKRKEIKKRKTINFTCKSIPNMTSLKLNKKSSRQNFSPQFNKSANKNKKRVLAKKLSAKEQTLKEF
jgi:hypothetical protein